MIDAKRIAARADCLRQLLSERILMLDGAMGTEIQQLKLDEADFRGSQFADHPDNLQGNNDLLSLTQSEKIAAIHRSFLEAGSDVIETNTFNGTAISQADYALEGIVHELNRDAAALTRRVADDFMAAHPGREVFVAGAIGPTNRTASLSPDVNRPGYRATSFAELRQAYFDQAKGLVEGGVDTLMIETIFDTLNAKAAIYACYDLFDQFGCAWPLMLSVTITDKSGRTLSGQTVEAFWNSVAHARPLSVGINCALGADDMRPYLQELSEIADCAVSCYPNAGLPNAFGEYDDTPENMARVLGEFADAGWLNLVGGCCGTGPAHLRAISARMQGVAPRRIPSIQPALRLSGLEALTA